MTLDDVLTSSGKFPKRALLADSYVQANAVETARRVTMMLTSFASVAKETSERKLSSGFRDKQSNAAAGGAKASCHLFGMAADIEDKDRKFATFCVANEDLLRHFGLWMEDPRYTKSWVHLQTRPVGSGSHIFVP